MKILCTFPGKYGDLLWALPTVRAIAEKIGEPVDLVIGGLFQSIAPLIAQQPYIHHCTALLDWEMKWEANQKAPIAPVQPPTIPQNHYDTIIHLGYPTWPEMPLPYYVEKIGQLQVDSTLAIDLDRPWIKADKSAKSLSTEVAIGFSDEHFELKYGIWALLTKDKLAPTPNGSWITLSGAPGSRWVTEGGFGECSWELAAHILTNCKLFLGCCSALHVLACAMGKPVLLMEPSSARWNEIFYPLGKTGRVTLILGNDGKPTWDVRHVKGEIHAHLQ